VEFDIEDFIQTEHWLNASDEWSFSAHWLQPDWALWCLSHNIETAAALSAVRNLSWIRGWDAARTLQEFASVPTPAIVCHPGQRCGRWPECESCGPARL